MRAFLTLTFVIISLLLSLMPNVASAQITMIDDGPRAEQELGWCSIFPGKQADGTSNNVACGFSDPVAACQFQNEQYNPKGGFVVTGTTRTSPTGAGCETQRVACTETPCIPLPLASVSLSCVGGSTRNGGICQSDPVSNVCNGCGLGGVKLQRGNPVDIVSGIKTQMVEDFSTADGRFFIRRNYRSRIYSTGHTLDIAYFGLHWTLVNHPRILLNHAGSPQTFFHVLRPNGIRHRASSRSDGTYGFSRGNIGGGGGIGLSAEIANFSGSLSLNNNTTIIALTNDAGTVYEYQTRNFNGFNTPAVLIKITYKDGYSQNLTYNSADKISQITDSFGRSATFEYNVQDWILRDDLGNITDQLFRSSNEPKAARIGNIKKITLPDNSVLEYSYGSFGDFNETWGVDERLQSVTRTREGQVIHNEIYHYEREEFPFLLTGITDAAGIRYASWDYDSQGMVASSEHAGGVDNTQFNYVRSGRGLFFHNLEFTHTVTNPLGRVTVYDISSSVVSGDHFVRSAENLPSANNIGDRRTFSYKNDLKTSTTDKEGRITQYTYDSQDRPITVTRAAGTDEEVTISTTWHPQYRVPTQVVRPGLTSSYVYDEAGRMTSMTQTDTSSNSSGAPRVWAYTYDGPNVASVDGPLAGSSDTRFYTWDNERMTSMTNEVGHVTRITQHNPIGAPMRIFDANDIETRLGYDSEHKLTSITVDPTGRNAVSRITYNDVDNVTSVTSPNGTRITILYDDARRVIGLRNSAGEKIDYELNNMGGILNTTMSDDAGQIAYVMNQVFDERNRVIEMTKIGGQGGISETTMEYDRESNLVGINDARNNDWEAQFDNLDRLVKEIDPLGAETDYGLAVQDDSRNPLSTVSDARDVTTNYVRNGFGEVIREVSLEAGTTEYVRDTRGLVTQMTDGRDIVTNYTYDAASRLLSETYPSESSSDISYTYDEGANGIGELTTTTEDFGQTTYSFDTLSHMTSMTREIDGQSYTCLYTYDLSGEVLTETYPSGRTIRMTRDDFSRIVSIEARAPNETLFIPLLSNISYAPFGPLTGADFADGNRLTLGYDTAYRAKSLRRESGNGALMDISFDHDDEGDIIAMNDNVRPERSQTFAYDPISRLIQATGGYGDIDYRYNLVGDRTERNFTPLIGPLEQQLYNYDSATARLTNVTQDNITVREFEYDGSGNIISDERTAAPLQRRFTYEMDATGRLVTVLEDGAVAARYNYDTYEQRISKEIEGETAIHYHYDEEGRLIAETDGTTGETLREYVWLGLTPIATFAANDNVPEDPEAPVTTNPDCDEEGIAALEASLAQSQATEALWQDYATLLENLQAIRQDQLTQVEVALETATGFRRFVLLWTQQFLRRSVVVIESESVRAQDTLTQLEAEAASLTEQAAAAQAICDAPIAQPQPPVNDNIAGLTFLHADHLGRPAFATDTSGEIVWDGGITTPFGVQLETLGALTQNLMFPGQYEDLDTEGAGVTLSHNWHRTYDPTLGRYLQSDPIGLAGGLNRYAYVGGNPMSMIDPMGLRDRTGVQGTLEVAPGAQILGWARDLNGGNIVCGCDGASPPEGADVDFVFLPLARPDKLGNQVEIIKFYGNLKINADGTRENTGYPIRRFIGNTTRVRRSNFPINNYNWFAAMGVKDPSCRKIFEGFSPKYFTPNTPQNKEVLEIRRNNGFEYP